VGIIWCFFFRALSSFTFLCCICFFFFSFLKLFLLFLQIWSNTCMQHWIFSFYKKERENKELAFRAATSLHWSPYLASHNLYALSTYGACSHYDDNGGGHLATGIHQCRYHWWDDVLSSSMINGKGNINFVPRKLTKSRFHP